MIWISVLTFQNRIIKSPIRKSYYLKLYFPIANSHVDHFICYNFWERLYFIKIHEKKSIKIVQNVFSNFRSDYPTLKSLIRAQTLFVGGVMVSHTKYLNNFFNTNNY